MTSSFKQSINIVRDSNKHFEFIPTPNAKNVFSQIVNDYKIGVRAFNIVGSYGTGKSSFLLALSQYLVGDKNYFGERNGYFGKIEKFDFIRIVGSYDSLRKTISEHIKYKPKKLNSKKLIKELDKYYQSIDENTCLIIIVDEFGKNLEYAAQNNPEDELYFIQLLAEYANDYENDVLLLTTLHQNFNAYAFGLTTKQKLEWAKVKGRLKDVTFNEPVEQLLYLATSFLNGKSKNKQANKLIDVLVKSNITAISGKIDKKAIKALYPLDLLSASILTLALQKYGQNERSLFTFLNGQSRFGLYKYDSDRNPYYNLSCVYDYLEYNFYSFLSTKYNPHYTNWQAIKSAIERAAVILDESLLFDGFKLIKTIGLLNIFAGAGTHITEEFLNDYCKLSLGISNAKEILQKLESAKVLLFKKYKSQYVLFEGTDLDLELELINANEQVSLTENIIEPLKNYFHLPYLPAKAVYYELGTPRFFEFHITDEPIDIEPRGKVDGVINLVFSEKLSETDLLANSQENENPIVYAHYKQIADLKSILFEIAKIDHLLTKQEIKEDKVAFKELSNLKSHEIEKLNEYVLDNLFNNTTNVTWIYHGKIQDVKNRTQFNKLLSKICREVYSETPIFRNELVNRHKISTSISTARRKYFAALIENWNVEDIGFSKDKYPAEKTVYLSLLKETGIHRCKEEEQEWEFKNPSVKTFKGLWTLSENFLNSAKINRKGINEFELLLSSKPIKLKKTFIDFWIPTFLFIKREEFALFKEGRYIPYLSVDEIDLIYKKPSNYQIKTFNVSGLRLDLFNKYRELISKKAEKSISQKGFIDTIKPFLTFYKSLSNYTKKTKVGLSTTTLRFRETIKNAKDPERTFFEDFPKALGYNNLDLLNNSEDTLKLYIDKLQIAIRELRSCFDNLLYKIEKTFVSFLGYENMDFIQYKEAINERYKGVKKHLLLPHQKTFLNRVLSPLDDRSSWINSITNALINKRLDQIADEEVDVLLDKLVATFKELDNLSELHQFDLEEGEEVIKFELTTTKEGTKPYQVRLSTKQNKEAEKLYKKVSKLLDKNTNINQVVLTKLLKETLDD